MTDLENWLQKLRMYNGILSCLAKQRVTIESLSYRKTINFRHICFGSGTETCSAGVALLLHERHAKNVASAKVISDRVMYVDLTVGGWKLRSIAVYAPHAGYSDDALNAFFEQVHVAVMGACREGRKTILGGDFNLQLQVGNRGAQISALANAFGLTITNDDEHHSPSAEKWTFSSSMGETPY